jgi:hypothetical protein
LGDMARAEMMGGVVESRRCFGSCSRDYDCPMNVLTFEIKPSPETNDHEVLVLVDGKTVLGEGLMGVDPPEFFAQFAKPNAGQLLVGRCECGVVGCGDYLVEVETATDSVIWRGEKELRFERSSYENTVRQASSEFSWEDQKRRGERLAKKILNGCRTEDGFAFQWASARIAPKTMRLSFLKAGQQKMLEFGWDEATDESVIQGARRLRRQLNEQ